MTRRAQLGMAMFLIAETVFFFLLILAFRYFATAPYLSSRNGWILSVLLLSSALAMWRAVSGSRLWINVTIVLGAAFLAGLLAVSSSALTGIHGLHILAGLVALALVPASALRAMALYWYFLTAVWLAIFLAVYRGGAA